MSAAEIQLWIIVSLLVILVTGILFWPILRVKSNKSTSREAYDIQIYKDQLLEIESDLDRGLLSQYQGEAARTEIKRRMLISSDNDKKLGEHQETGSSTVIPIIISISAPVCAVLLYLSLGSPAEPDQPFLGREAKRIASQTQQQKNLIEATSKMVAHLQRNPKDLRGWTLLARSYLSNSRYADAVSAFSEAYRLNDGDPDLAVDYAEALSLAEKSIVTQEAHALFLKALEIDKLNVKARYYLGMFQAQQGNVRSALQIWVDLVSISRKDAPWLPTVRKEINSAARELGVNAKTIRPTPEAQAIAIEVQKAYNGTLTDNTLTEGPTTADIKAAMGMTQKDRVEMIKSMVERLAMKMKENPKDKIGWLRLERAYRVIGETTLANEAAAQAAKLP